MKPDAKREHETHGFKDPPLHNLRTKLNSRDELTALQFVRKSEAKKGPVTDRPLLLRVKRDAFARRSGRQNLERQMR